jgi:pimeloyl-ACP methyl ester carboxylesterase
MSDTDTLWHERGGSGTQTVLFLHGLGATGAVWNGVRRLIENRPLQWVVPDLSGHGSSAWSPRCSVGQLATHIAPLVHDTGPLYIVGHSLGAYIGLALASRWFGVEVAGVLGVGPKITWSDTDLRGARDFAARPMRWYPQESEAIARYRRVSGLDEKCAPEIETIARGVTRAEQGYRLAQDPRTFGVAGAPFATLAASAAARVMLARGEHDAMVTLDELRLHQRDAGEIAGAGHNAHVEDPAAIVRLLDQLMDHA